MAEKLRCIVACTDESGRLDSVVAKAMEMATEQKARLILYDVDAPGAFTSPRPNVWAAEGEQEVYDHPLDPVAIEKLGRHALAAQVQQARKAGIDAYGWLPDHKGGAALGEYAEREGADLVLVPQSMEPEEYIPELRETVGATLEVQAV